MYTGGHAGEGMQVAYIAATGAPGVLITESEGDDGTQFSAEQRQITKKPRRENKKKGGYEASYRP